MADNKGSEQKVREAFICFNKELLAMMAYLIGVHGQKYPGLLNLKNQITAFTAMDPGRKVLAETAWPMYSRYRDLIKVRDATVFLEHDMAGLKKRAGLDGKVMWANSPPSVQAKIWELNENLLDALDDINDIRPFKAIDNTTAAANIDAFNFDVDEEKKSAAGGEKKKLVVDSLASKDSESKDSKPTADEKALPFAEYAKSMADNMEKSKSTKSGRETNKLAIEMMNHMKSIMGDENEDLTAMMNKVSEMENLGDDAQNQEPTANDQEMLSRLLSGMMKKIIPSDDDDNNENEDNDNNANLSENERLARKATRTINNIREEQKAKQIVMNLLGVENTSTDPSIKAEIAREKAADAERAKNPEQSREFSIVAHFNYKIILILKQMVKLRGQVKSPLDSTKLRFPELNEAFQTFRLKFVENPSTDVLIDPVGEWLQKHQRQYARRDDSLFAASDNEFLISMKAGELWRSFTPASKANVWNILAHPMKLANIHRSLKASGLGALNELVTNILRSNEMPYDADASKLNKKKLVQETLWKGSMGTTNMTLMKDLFQNLQNDKDHKLLQGLLSLVKNLPIGKTGGEEEDEGDDDDDDDEDESKDSKSDSQPEQKPATTALEEKMLNLLIAPKAETKI